MSHSLLELSAIRGMVCLRTFESKLYTSEASPSDLKGNHYWRDEPVWLLAQTSPLMTNAKSLGTAEMNIEVTEGCTEGKYSLRCKPKL